MEIRCRNCHHAFTLDLAPGDLPEAVSCPQCDFANLLGRGGGTALASSARCARCGKEMAAVPTQAVPICTECQGLAAAPAAADAARWMVRKEGGGTWGPFDTSTIRAWLDAGKITPTDELAPEGGQWQPVFEVAPFSERFDVAQRFQAAKAYKAQRKTEAAAQARLEKPPRQIPWRPVLRTGAAVTAAVAAWVGAWYTAEHRLLVAPEPMVEEVRGRALALWTERIEERQRPPDKVAAEARAVLAELAVAPLGPEETAPGLRLRGQALSFTDRVDDLPAARAALERAAVAAPEDGVTLAALAELYARLILEQNANLSGPALRLLDRAAELDGANLEVRRARAAFLICTGSAAKGLELARAVLEANPRDAQAQYLVGLAYRLSDPADEARAAEAFTAALELNPRHQAALREAAASWLAQGRSARAASALRAKLALDPHHVATLHALGALMESVGSAQGALEAYRQAISASRERHVPSLIAAGVILAQSEGDLAGGRRLLELAQSSESMGVEPTDVRVRGLTHLAQVALLQGDLRTARDQAEAALSLDGGDGPALYTAGLVAYRQGRREDADRMLRQAATAETRHPEQARIRFALGMLAQSDGKAREAITELKAAIDADADHRKAQLAYAGALLSVEQLEPGLAALDAYARRDPWFERRCQYRAQEYWDQLFDVSWVLGPLQRVVQERYYQAAPPSAMGLALYHLGAPVKAAQALTRAAELDANAGSPLFLIGILNLEAGQTEAALTAFNRAVEVDPQTGIYHAYMAEALGRLGRYDEAERAWQRARQYLLKAPTVGLGMGTLALRQGRSQEARAALEEAQESEPRFVSARLVEYQNDL